ncbi:MAG: heavy metal-responsive transcriptional regulator [Phycisphaerae bacterium]
MTIGEVARAAGVAATTLRYYEREGILSPTVRNGAGYRLYSAQAVDRLQFIRAAQAIGFTLDEIRKLLDLDREDGRTCRNEVQPLIENRLSEIDNKLQDLKRVRATLSRALDRCRRSRGECAVLKDLTSRNKTR